VQGKLIVVLLFTTATFAQSWKTGTIVKWEVKAYSQSAHITRNRVVYSVKIDKTVYQITRNRDKDEIATGQQVECRLEKTHFFVRDDRGREIKYEVVGIGPTD